MGIIMMRSSISHTINLVPGVMPNRRLIPAGIVIRPRESTRVSMSAIIIHACLPRQQ
jgi:hypothetical protein